MHDRDRVAPGLNLFTNAHFCTTQLMDMDGNVLHEWSPGEECYRWGNSILLPNGDLFALGRTPHEKGFDANSAARYLMLLSWDGDVLWKKPCTSHHDVDITPDGRLLALTYDHVQVDSIHPEAPVQDQIVTMLSRDGEVLEEVSLYEVMASNPAVFNYQKLKPRTTGGQFEVDLLHANVVEWAQRPHLAGRHAIFAPGTVLTCLREQDSIAVFDWASRKLIWAWGKGVLSGPHDATILPTGNILIFDNGLSRVPRWSRVVELDPLAERIVWEYQAPDREDFYTGTRGANQRLSNGNTLIVESGDARAFEVTPEGEIVWEFVNSNTTDEGEPSAIVRMRRYEGLTYEELAAAAGAGRLERRD